MYELLCMPNIKFNESSIVTTPLILSPRSTVILCPFDQHVLTCTSMTMSAQLLQWRIRDTRGRMGSRSVDYELSSAPSVTVGTTICM